MIDEAVPLMKILCCICCILVVVNYSKSPKLSYYDGISNMKLVNPQNIIETVKASKNAESNSSHKHCSTPMILKRISVVQTIARAITDIVCRNTYTIDDERHKRKREKKIRMMSIIILTQKSNLDVYSIETQLL